MSPDQRAGLIKEITNKKKKGERRIESNKRREQCFRKPRRKGADTRVSAHQIYSLKYRTTKITNIKKQMFTCTMENRRGTESKSGIENTDLRRKLAFI